VPDDIIEVQETVQKPKESRIIQLFGDTPKSRILDFLIANKGLSFSKTEISRGANVFKTAFFKQNQKKHHYDYFGDLLRFDVFKPVKNGRMAPKYTLNTENKVVRALLKVEFALIEQAIKQELQKCAKEGVEVIF